MLVSQISKNQSGKEYIIQGQLSTFLPKISLRSVENYFTQDFVIVNIKFFQIASNPINSVGKG